MLPKESYEEAREKLNNLFAHHARKLFEMVLSSEDDKADLYVLSNFKKFRKKVENDYFLTEASLEDVVTHTYHSFTEQRVSKNIPVNIFDRLHIGIHCRHVYMNMFGETMTKKPKEGMYYVFGEQFYFYFAKDGYKTFLSFNDQQKEILLHVLMKLCNIKSNVKVNTLIFPDSIELHAHYKELRKVVVEK